MRSVRLTDLSARHRGPYSSTWPAFLKQNARKRLCWRMLKILSGTTKGPPLPLSWTPCKMTSGTTSISKSLMPSHLCRNTGSESSSLGFANQPHSIGKSCTYLRVDPVYCKSCIRKMGQKQLRSLIRLVRGQRYPLNIRSRTICGITCSVMLRSIARWETVLGLGSSAQKMLPELSRPDTTRMARRFLFLRARKRILAG